MKNKKRNQPNRSFLETIDNALGKNDWIIFWVLFGITLLAGILLYDPRVSTGGDDSTYVVSAHEFLKSFKFPAYQGPLYPIVLSLVDAVFGMSLTAFKAFSLASILAFMLFTFLAFRKHIPPFLLFVSLLLVSINSYVLYYASQTYSEAFYMFMLALFLFVFFRFFIRREGQSLTFPEEIKRHLLLAITLVGVILTRSIGYAVFLALLGYFLIYRQWKNAGYAAGCFLLCLGIYQLVKYALWGDISLQAAGQGSSLLSKDFYKPELGYEDPAGFFQRFLTNSNWYISNFFISMLGLRESILPEGVYAPTKTMLTILVYGLGLAGIWMTFKQNRYLFFIGMLTGLCLIVTFVILQTTWNQNRLIVPALPYMVMLLFATLYYWFKEHFRAAQLLIVVPAIVLFFAAFSDTTKAIGAAQKLKNEYSGLTPDWRNYAQASAWAAKNLPEDALVACRKPSISTIYGKGKEFYGIYQIRSSGIQYLIEKWSENESRFLMISYEHMTDGLYAVVRRYYEARLLAGQRYYLLLDNEDGGIRQELAKWPDVPVIESSEALKSLIGPADNTASVYYADSLLLPLKTRGVTHILAASLRLNPYVKDGNIINTVERIIGFTEEKYPNLYTPVQQFGTPNDEPSQMLQINWDALEQ